MRLTDLLGLHICYVRHVFRKEDKLKVTKIIHKAMRPTDEGDWVVWCMVYINGQYKYQGLVFGPFEEARAVKEGQLLDIEKVRLRSYRMGSEGWGVAVLIKDIVYAIER